MNGIEEAQRDIGQGRSNRQAFETVLHRRTELQHAEDRSLIVKLVIIRYVLAVGAIILYLMVRGGICSDESTVASIFDVIKIGVLPIVTLVMGYYFGSART